MIAPRSDYQEVVRRLAIFGQFHPLEDKEPVFDPSVQALAVRSVRLYAQADEVIRDLSIVPGPGTIDIIFRGEKTPVEEFTASDWNDLITKAEGALNPISDKVKADKAALQSTVKVENDTRAQMEGLRAVSRYSFDLSTIGRTGRLSTILVVADTSKLPEFQSSVPGVIFLSQSLSDGQSLVLIAAPMSEAPRIAKALKALELKPLTLPAGLPQNPADAYGKLSRNLEAAREERAQLEARLSKVKEENQAKVLAVRELAEHARNALDKVRIAGGFERFATITGFVPTKLNEQFDKSFGDWILFTRPAASDHGDALEIPTLMDNPAPLTSFEGITREQGTPGKHELDPTPLISFVFPVFFGIMFGDLGHGLVVTLFALLLRQRGTGSIRRWGNIFLAAGISACVVGVMVGEFFGFPLYQTLHIPGGALLEIVSRSSGRATLSQTGLNIALEIAILIGVAHLATGLSMDVAQAARAHEKVELVTEKIPALSMYIFGVLFGIAFIGAHYSFQILSSVGPAPLLGVSNSLLGAVAIVGVVASMVALLLGKGIAVMAGKVHGVKAGSAIGNGAIEVFERISGYMANTISYVRLAIMLMIHAELLLVVNMLLNLPLYVAAPMVLVFNILIIVFEVLIVYIQDLRLHIYEFFTKFYRGTGTPFRGILPEGVRAKIKWL